MSIPAPSPTVIPFIFDSLNFKKVLILKGPGFHDILSSFEASLRGVVAFPYIKSFEKEFGQKHIDNPIHVKDEKFEETLELCDKASPYALTGAIFAKSEKNIEMAYNALRFTAGNFYINDKPTGAVVAQQPFGGARASGTNDKAGGPLNLLRWISPRSVKRTSMEIHDWTYPFMKD